MKYRPLLGLLLASGLMSVTMAQQAELPQPVRHILDIRKVPHDSLSVFVQDVDSGEIVLRWQDDVPRNPASTMKLLTTLVGLDLLGSTYKWTTDVFALGELGDGRLDGDLLIRGHGDPFLVTERVWQMLRLVRQSGIHQIEGNLLIDDSYFEVPDHDPAEFDRQPLRAYNVAPNALLMNFKVVRYWFEPDHDRNAVRVWVDPPLENLRVENKLALRRGYCGGYQRGITIAANEAIDKMIFSGRFPTGCKSYAMDRTALSHNEFAYGLFTSVWRESGGEFRGGWMNARAPEDVEPIVSFESLPLAEIISRVNKNSNNVMARQILYTLSAEVLGPPGTENGGRKVIEDWLADTGIEFPTLTLDNGAGLSRETRVSAREYGALLEFAWRKPYMPEYLASMAVSGLDGTLRRKFDDAHLTGQAHLKTGSLDHVAAIAGYLQASSGRRFSVVMLHNFEDVHRGPGEEAQVALLRWLYEQ
ncbi:MAG: D-alanyl-D-alanine carboxypeptidase/D-alanyl-D-alanine-endopeptidase [Gammaproteobacteria bacterium]|jgi:D-alanyl-D-alanine carboxypeptidase/D-alanyl-D-alanine-endopeptidase (penicillin-binding protein 4)|nr:D-alanyl-D-alanine carboxypeptidase/D-alanyl-D-alanine-endopeptidase [Gammaproteobacteria bacterium]MDH3757711.1 D-alanyl-D-alanine carboxypeptidase/D-alanyl-D-alanine-endopeptidase [Gammaproteobacteria bacterium]MDH3849349.1 D-alanyl-D-alanine carboxypeptidase/D-alanyl-D-alanine-endopeptidase [Gammaproteobacteria bacterium]MDH3862710.1 D-alanyl-D-alanine carboxypeptidase/D-alanyl-D-alanine-endopeptidase [Gammaproteobacteria bacterium]MDH3954584.1 D-alanyl-D-alanine carboxypeptidase/D-alanyl